MRTIEPRNFFYISKTRIEMLQPQLGSKLPLPDLKISGYGLELNFKNSPAGDNVTRHLLDLIRKMKKHRLVTLLSAADFLETSKYYEDKGKWFNGLFSLNGNVDSSDKPEMVITYLLWRYWKDAIVLLAGSPMNVLGENTPRTGVRCQGTSGTWATVLKFAETYFRTDETNFVEVTGKSVSNGSRSEDFAVMNWDPQICDDSDIVVPLEVFSNTSGLAIAVFCVRYLSRLQKDVIDTIFIISKRMELKERPDLPAWARELLNRIRERDDQIDSFRKCKRVYIGSPLYTAVG